MTAAEASTGSLDLARVIQQTFAVIGRNFVLLLLLTLALLILPIAIFVGIAMMIAFAAGVGLTVGGAAGAMAGLGAAGLFMLGGFPLLLLLIVAAATTLQAALIHAAAADLNGRKATFGECVNAALKQVVPLTAVAILAFLGIVVGLALLIVPGLILMVRWYVALPARMVEGTGVLDAFRRSAELTRGNRWVLFGLIVIFFVGEMVVSGVVTSVLGDWAGTGLSLLTAMVGATLTAVVYYELRRVREGIGPEALASVFD